MKPEDKLKHEKKGTPAFLRKLGDKVVSLFQPEEVEVTFKEEGNTKSYTYIKVPHKQVA
jgi:hypothetical protein